MACNCKAKKKIQATKRYFGLQSSSENQKITLPLVAKAIGLIAIGICISPILLIMILGKTIFSGNTIQLDKFILKKTR